MHLSMNNELSQRLEQRLALRLSPELRLALNHHLYGLRLELIAAVRGTRYEPRAKCPTCNYQMKDVEILKGFNNDPHDFDTTCPRCRQRFLPQLVSSFMGIRAEIHFYCAAQLLPRLKGLETYTPENIKAQDPAVYHSAIVHYGNLKKAFAKNGNTYTYPEVADWRPKAEMLLGKLPDTVIADCANVSASAIRRMRK